MGGATASPSVRNKDPWYIPAFALADMGAATARGVTRGTLGLPGDLESLVRHLTGGKQHLPTSEDFNKILPPLDPILHTNEGYTNPYDTLGALYGVPIYGGAAKLLGKGSSKILDAVSKGTEDFNPSRRSFLKGSAAVAAAATLGVKGLGKFGKAGEDIKSAEKIAKNIPKHKFDSLADYNTHLNDEAKKAYDEFGVHSGEDPDRWMAKWKEELAQAHENNYKQSKFFYKDNPDLKDPFTGNKLNDEFLKNVPNQLDEFSPKAKAEMKDLKGRVAESNYFNRDNEHWSNALDDPEAYPHQGWWTDADKNGIPF